MDDLQHAYALRAKSALDLLTGQANTAGPTAKKARAFIEIAHTALGHRQKEVALNVMRNSHNELVQKAVAEVLDIDGIWAGPLAQELARSYVASVAQFSLLDQLMKYGRVLPKSLRQVMIASDTVGNAVLEGDPKPVRNLSLNLGTVQPINSVALIVMTNELARFAGPEGQAMFEAELSKAVTRAMNQGVMDAFSDSGSSTVAAGADALASMRAGLAAVEGSEAYVVAVNQADANYLVTVDGNRSMTPRGGELFPGIHCVTVDGLIGQRIFPASRFAFWDGGLEIKASGVADVDMRDSPSDPATLTSLFQTDTTAVRAERLWNILGPTDGVIHVEGA